MEVRFWLLTLTPLLALLSYVVLLVIVLRRMARSRLYRFFALYLVVMAVWSLGSAMMRLNPDRILLWNRVLIASAMVMPLAYFGFVQAFLDERQNRWLWVGIVSVLGLEIANALGLMVTDARLLEGGLLSFDTGPATHLAAIYGALFWSSSIWRLARAYHRTSASVVRNRIRYPLTGLLFVVLGTATNAIPALGAFPIDHAANLVNALLLAYAILRYQLLDITVVIRKGLLYSIPTAIIGTVYFLLIFLATRLFRAFAGLQIFLLSLIVAVITAVVAQPLRDRAQLWIDRLFFREKYDSSLMLQRLSRTVASLLDLDKLTNMILDEVTTTMHIERAAFFLKQEGGGGFRLIAQRGLDPNAYFRLRQDHPIVHWLSGHEHALTSRSVDVMPQFKALWGQEKEDLERIGAELFIPLKAKGDLVGVFAVGPRRSEEPYSQDDQLILTTLANQTAVAIENARLYKAAQQELIERKRAEETLRQRNRELALLNRAGQTLSSTLDLDRVLVTVLEEVRHLLDVVASSVWLIAPETDDLICQQAAGPQSEIVRGWRLAPGEGVAGWVARSGESLVVPDLWADERHFRGVDQQTGLELRSILSVPLRAKQDVIGVLQVVDKVVGRFKPTDLKLVEPLAATAAIAIENARLYEEAEELRAFNENIVLSMGEGILLENAMGHITFVNPRTAELLGYTPQELTGRRWMDIVDPEHLAAVEEEAAKQSQGIASQYEIILLTREGQQVPVIVSARPLFDDGHFDGVLSVFADITERKHLEEQMRRQDRLAAVGQLAAGIAHDFNNLLTAIMLYAQMLLRKPHLPPDLAPSLEIILSESRRAAQLVQQILDFSRRSMMEAKTVDLVSFIREVIDILQRTLPENIRLLMEVGADEYVVNADPTRIQQVLMNLVVNARDAMPGGGELRISLSRMEVEAGEEPPVAEMSAGEWVCLAVSDTGTGMPPEVLSHLFEPFFTTKPVGQGTGLGLAQVYGIVKLHKGCIGVETEVGRGTTFRIYLPTYGAGKVEKALQEETPPLLEGQGETILLVEDEEKVLAVGRDILESLGYRVLTAADGREALEVYRSAERVDLVLTDIVMPEMGGRELVRELNKTNPGLRALAITGYALTEDLGKLKEEGILDVVLKPFEMNTLAEAVRRALDAE